MWLSCDDGICDFERESEATNAFSFFFFIRILLFLSMFQESSARIVTRGSFELAKSMWERECCSPIVSKILPFSHCMVNWKA